VTFNDELPALSLRLAEPRTNVFSRPIQEDAGASQRELLLGVNTLGAASIADQAVTYNKFSLMPLVDQSASIGSPVR
jgi:hypothetical protein